MAKLPCKTTLLGLVSSLIVCRHRQWIVPALLSCCLLAIVISVEQHVTSGGLLGIRLAGVKLNRVRRTGGPPAPEQRASISGSTAETA